MDCDHNVRVKTAILVCFLYCKTSKFSYCIISLITNSHIYGIAPSSSIVQYSTHEYVPLQGFDTHCTSSFTSRRLCRLCFSAITGTGSDTWPKTGWRITFCVYLYRIITNYTLYIWLVVDLPLWKIWVCQLGWWNSQYMEKHVPNHQPAMIVHFPIYGQNMNHQNNMLQIDGWLIQKKIRCHQTWQVVLAHNEMVVVHINTGIKPLEH